MIFKRTIIFLTFILCFSGFVGATPSVKAAGTIYYVSTTGSDSNNGTINSPFLTIQKASSVMAAGDTAYIRGGTYHETVTPTNSGTSGAPITYQAYPGETVTISGADLVTGWTLDSGNIYKAPMNWNLGAGNQIFVNGSMNRLAQFPNWSTGPSAPNDADLFNVGWATKQSGTATSITDTNLNKPDNYWVGATVIVQGWWTTQAATITSSSGSTINFTPLAVNDGYTNPGNSGVNKYMIAGLKGELNREGEWYYDSNTSQLYLWAAGGVNPGTLTVEAKARTYAVDLTGRSYINISGFNIIGATITTVNATNCNLQGLDMKYISHTIGLQSGYAHDNTGVVLEGSYNTIRDSQIAYSSGNGIVIRGDHNNVINNLIHETDYLGTYNSSLAIDGGEQILVSYNTAYNTGRSILDIQRVDDSIIEYNDMSYAGKLSFDLGIVYAVGEDGGNTEIRYNKIHDVNVHLGTGVYFDNYSSNFQLHHNTIWNTPQWSSYYIGGMANFMLAYDNMVDRSISISYNELKYGTRVYNNVAPGGIVGNPETAIVYNNSTGSFNPNVYPAAGHNFTTPPNPVFQHSNSTPDFRNRVTNFELQNGFDSYTKTGNQNVTNTTTGTQGRNGFDHNYAIFGTGQNGIEQTVTDLKPNTTYEFSGWSRAASGEEIWLGIKDYGGSDVHQTVANAGWTQKVFTFTTGATNTSVTFYAWKNSTGSGIVYAGDFGLTFSDSNLAQNGVAAFAAVSATSVSSDVNLQPVMAIDGDSTTSYNSTNTPGFPQYLTMKWLAGQSFSQLSIQCRYCQNQGITNFDVEVSDDGSTNWTTVASSGNVTYSYNNSTLETKTITFPIVDNKKGVRMKINNANLQSGYFAINEIGVSRTAALATASASVVRSEPGFMPNKAIDGNQATAYMSTESPGLPQYFTLNWQTGQTFNTVSITCGSCTGQGITNFDVQVSDDGSTNWTTVAASGSLTYTGAQYETKMVNFPQVMNKKGMRIKINSANLTWAHYVLNEINVENNLSLAKLATPSASVVRSESNFQPSAAIDGNPVTAYVSTESPGLPQYFNLNWQTEQTFNTVSITCGSCTGQGVTNFDVQVSDDGSTNWTTVASSGTLTYTGSGYETKTVNFAQVTNKKGVRLKINSANLQWAHYVINEINVDNIPPLAGTATASSSYNSGSLPTLAVDGSTTTKWSSQYGETHWLQVDLGQSYNLLRYVVKHAGAYETWGTQSLNTRDFKFQVSSDGTNWSDVDTVTGNTSNVTDHNISANGRYIRLYITNPQTETTYRAARIFELQVYGK